MKTISTFLSHLNLFTAFPTLLALTVSLLLGSPPIQAQDANQLFSSSLNHLASLISPSPETRKEILTATIRLLQGPGHFGGIQNQSIHVSWQSPSRFKVTIPLDGETISVGLNEHELWMHASGTGFGLTGKPGIPVFANGSLQGSTDPLPKIRLPLTREQIALLPVLLKVETLSKEVYQDEPCTLINVQAQPEAIKALKLPSATMRLWIRDKDLFPARIELIRDEGTAFIVDIPQIGMAPPQAEAYWEIPNKEDEKPTEVSISHLTRFLSTTYQWLQDKGRSVEKPKLSDGLMAVEGQGRLEVVEGQQVLFLEGTPAEMGHQQGVLMKATIANLVERLLYGVGVGSSFSKGSWFFAEIEEAWSHLEPHVNPVYLAEMDSMAEAAGLSSKEIRLANFFPELFHCSGFSIYGQATKDAIMYHGRVLDYLRGVGLEENALIVVYKPSYGNAWVNIGYAGFTGSVTAMNEHHISIGEMGGGGEGNWDGKPMAQLVREVMERATTLEEAIDIMRAGPRTCEYYYVISDGKSGRAVGIAATPEQFEILQAGELHPKLPQAFPDTVLMSAGDRFQKLAERVSDGFGKFEAQSAWDLMKSPVCMESNIQTVLFMPQTLDFWVAQADERSTASHNPPKIFNLEKLLRNTKPIAIEELPLPELSR